MKIIFKYVQWSQEYMFFFGFCIPTLLKNTTQVFI